MSAPSEGNETWIWGYWCVAWVDLLGQRKAFMDADYVPIKGLASPVQMKAFDDAVRVSVGAIRGMRKIHAGIREGMNTSRYDEDIFAGFPRSAQETARLFQSANVRERTMSDGMILACPLQSEDGNVPLRGIYEIVLTCASMMLAQLVRGHPIRGGIDVGVGVEIDGELFGSALVKAYTLESECAKYPRIVVGSSLYEYLHTLLARPRTDIRAAYEHSLAEGILGAIKFDQDLKTILDYAGPQVHGMQVGNNEKLSAGTKLMLEEARAFAARTHAKYQDEKDDKLAARYAQLVQYLARGFE